MTGPVCYLCGSTSLVSHAGALDLGVAGVTVLRCVSCGLAQNYPRTPKDYARLSPLGTEGDTNTRHWASFEDYERQQYSTKVFLADWVERVLSKERPDRAERPRFADIGCHTGLLCAVLLKRARLNLDFTCIEPDAAAAEWGARRHNLSILAGHLDSLATPARSFDGVGLFEVLEHSADPLALLIAARRLLRPRGLLFVVVPNVMGCQTGAEFFADEHMFHFSPDTLNAMARKASLSLHAMEGSYRPHPSFRPLTALIKRQRWLGGLGRRVLSSTKIKSLRGSLVKPGMILALYRTMVHE